MRNDAPLLSNHLGNPSDAASLEKMPAKIGVHQVSSATSPDLLRFVAKLLEFFTVALL